MRTPFAPQAALAAILTLAGTGCAFVYSEPVQDGARGNHAPWVSDDTDRTWWQCSYDDESKRWYFEFQSWVYDPETYQDVETVYVEFHEPGGDLLDSYDMNYEQDGTWGGWVWEDETDGLYCGDAYDVRFVAVDDRGAQDEFWIEGKEGER